MKIRSAAQFFQVNSVVVLSVRPVCLLITAIQFHPGPFYVQLRPKMELMLVEYYL